MPTLRWFGRSGVTSLRSIRMRPEVGLSKPATMRKHRGLAAARRPQQRDELALFDAEVEALDHDILIELLADVADFQECHC